MPKKTRLDELHELAKECDLMLGLSVGKKLHRSTGARDFDALVVFVPEETVMAQPVVKGDVEGAAKKLVPRLKKASA